MAPVAQDVRRTVLFGPELVSISLACLALGAVDEEKIAPGVFRVQLFQDKNQIELGIDFIDDSLGRLHDETASIKVGIFNVF